MPQFPTKSDDSARLVGATPSAYSLSLLPLASRGAWQAELAGSMPWINVKDPPYNAGGTSHGDDTAAIQAAIDDAIEENRYVFIPSGVYPVGQLNIGPQSGSSARFVSIIGAGHQQTRLNYIGPTDGICMNFSLIKYSKIYGIWLQNMGVKGTTIGMKLSGPDDFFGTQCLGNTIEHVNVAGFDIGVMTPGGADSSEIRYEHLSLVANNVGWQNNSSNTKNHVFNMLLMGENGIGMEIKAGNITVLGGSASINGVDFKTYAIGRFAVRDFYSESAGRFLESTTGGIVTIDNCDISDTLHADGYAISMGGFTDLRILGSGFEFGKIKAGEWGGRIYMEGNIVNSDHPRLPFSIYTPSIGSCRYWCINNATQTTVFYGDEIGANIEEAIWPVVSFPAVTLNGLPQMRIHQLQSLAHGTAAAGRNFRLQEQFATSDTLAVTFVRSTTVGVNTASLIVTGTGFRDADEGKQIILVGAGVAGADITTRIATVNSPTSLTIEYRIVPQMSGSVTAHIGANEPDDDYLIAIGSNAQETISWSSKATTGFTLTSSNASSTAIVDILIVR